MSIVTANVGTGFTDPAVHAVTANRYQRLRRRLRDALSAETQMEFSYGPLVADCFRALHREQPIDLIEMEESFGYCSDVQSRVDVPMVIRMHGPTFLVEVPENREKPFFRTRIKREGAALRSADFITAPSKCVLENARSYFDLSPQVMKHIPNPVPEPDPAQSWSVSECDRNLILYVGRFDQIKGGDIVLQAFVELLRRRPDLQLVFIGPDIGVPDPVDSDNNETVGLREYCQKLQAENACARIRHVEKLDQESIRELRLRAFVTLMASRWENQPYTLLEAMAQGCPVVATDVGGVGELIDDGVNGLLTASGDPAGLQSQIEKLLANSDLAVKLGNHAADYVREHHAPSIVVDSMLKLYREVAA